ncbi:hypothetical protein VFPPC_08361 [Pochonia chlamydosporia 170]|uniref:Uncharacterized protein n=1 Tax=Pochonia chlamydosporia 170 TaxID=1380566 RepID=A0A179FMR0_METCM|nr:hypothetical protein VFPPC_08361 [Pochonia chlamydosporia 170]OAQ66854.1 hypothetical protein VFPPC_08361 [Pochonia chlamydosporia 170]
MHPDNDESPDQWTDITGTNLGAKRMGHSKTLPKELASPFNDPIREDEVAEPQEFEIWEDAKSIPGSFVSDLPAWKEPQSTVRTVSPYPKPILQGGDDPNSEWETIAIDEETILKPSTRLRQRVEHGRLAFPVQDIMGRVRQATERAQRRNTDLIAPTSARKLAILPTFSTSNIPNDGLQRASSVYEDDKETCKPSFSSKQEAYTPEMSRALSKKRPFTFNFDRNVYGELVSSYSKSSSRASNDPFRYDGEGYSLFLNPSAEKEKVDDTVKVPVIKHVHLSPTSDEHPLSKLGEMVEATSGKKDTDGDWQTVTTEQAPHRALELTLRLNRDVGSSLADVSDASEDETFDQFIDASANSQKVRHTHHGRKGYDDISKTQTTSTGFPRQSHSVNRAQSRAAAAVRHLNRLSTDTSNMPKLSSKLSGLRKPVMSYNSLDSDPEQDEFETALPVSPNAVVETVSCRHKQWSGSIQRRDSQEILGLGTRDGDTPYKSRDFAHQSSLLDYSIPQLPFPLISLPEAALLQSERRKRGEEDHTEVGSMFAAKARSFTISTVSSYGPKTPNTPVYDAHYTSGLPKPQKAYQRHTPLRTLPYEPTQGQLNSSGILDTNSGSFFRTSLPTNTSLLSARFFRLSGFSARTRQRRDTLKHTSDAANLEYSFFSPSETELIRSAREDILYRRRQCPEEDGPQSRVFMVIVVITLLFPLIGLLALYGKFDATIAWYGKGQRGYLTAEQRGILKRQLFVEAVVYLGLIVSLSVYYSVHG